MLNTKEIYLNDSGAQYRDGTTDVTRTVHFGEPTPYEKDCFTYVLKGHIALAAAVFPDKIEGVKLDAITRAPLWQYVVPSWPRLVLFVSDCVGIAVVV